MKTPVKVSTKVQRRELLELFLGCQSRTSITFRCIFAGWDHLWFFLAEGRDTTSAIPVRVHRKYHISMYFLRRVISHFLPKEKNIMFSGKKTPSFQIIQERSFPSAALFEKTIFEVNSLKFEVWRKYHISVYYFDKDDLSFSV